MSEIRVDTIKSENGGGNVSFPKGISVTGVTTSTSFVGDLTGLTYRKRQLITLERTDITVNNITGVAGTFIWIC